VVHGSGEVWPHRHLLITERLRTRRDVLGLTQKQVVGRLAKLGVQTTNRTLSNLEHGAGVDVGRLPELAAALECTVSYLLGLTASPHRWSPDPVAAGTAPLTARPPTEPVPAHPGPHHPALPAAVMPANAQDVPSTDPDARSQPGHRTIPLDGACWILGIDVPDRHVPAGGSNLSNA
jgi:transcriptional regulator with XRE-family HTH domain